MPRVTATNIQQWAYPAGGLYAVGVAVDAAGNMFEAYAVNDGTNAGYAHVLKKSGTGAVLADLEIEPANGMKLDGCGLVQSGVDIHVYLVSHMPHFQNPEQLRADKYVWRGVAAPYAAGEPQVGAEGAYMPEEEANVDLQPVLDAIAALTRRVNEIDRHIVDNLKPKVAAALTEADVLTVGAFNGPQGRHEVYEQLVNTSYTGALGALREYGNGEEAGDE